MNKNLSTLALLAFMAIASILKADRITAYSSDESDSLKYHGKNCLGFQVNQSVEGHRQVAVDPRVYPLGSVLFIKGVGTFIATDCGSGVRGKHIDVCVSNRIAVSRFNTGNAEVKILRKGWASNSIYSSKRDSSDSIAPRCQVRLASIHERQSSKQRWV